MKEKIENNNNITANQPLSLEIDVKKYEQYLEESDMSAVEKAEYVETLWSVVREFIMMGFGVHPVQQAVDSQCGQGLPDVDAKRAFISQSMLDSNNTIANDLASVISSIETKPTEKGGIC